jgi:heme A synthase
VVDESHAGTPTDDRYPGSTVAAAVLMSLFFPLISLIVALFLLGRERSPGKRSSLRTWAIATAALIVVQILIAIGLFAAVNSGTDVGPPVEVVP